jgi:hypothetical protein
VSERFVIGPVAIVLGIMFFLARHRMLAANRASSAELFGRADPYRLAPRFTAAWSRAINVVVSLGFVGVGILDLVGVLHPGS